METVSLLMMFAVMLCFLRGSKFRPAQDLNPDLCDASAVLYQLSYRGQLGWGDPGAVAVLCVVNTGPMLIAVSITEMVILYKYVQPTNQPTGSWSLCGSIDSEFHLNWGWKQFQCSWFLQLCYATWSLIRRVREALINVQVLASGNLWVGGKKVRNGVPTRKNCCL